MRIYRLTEDGTRWPPAREGGWFVLGDPAKGGQKHHSANAVRVRSEEEVIELLSRGFSLRVETSTRPSLVRRGLYVDGQPIS